MLAAAGPWIIDSLFQFKKSVPFYFFDIVDNAPIHTSDDFEDELERWQKEDLYVQFLRTLPASVFDFRLSASFCGFLNCERSSVEEARRPSRPSMASAIQRPVWRASHLL